MKWPAAFFTGLFTLAALVQWNDPDPYVWILGYLVVAALSAAASMGRPLFVPSVFAAILFGLWFLSLSPSLIGAPSAAFTSFEMRAAAHEEPREAIGLALGAVWCGVLAIWAQRRSRAIRRDRVGAEMQGLPPAD